MLSQDQQQELADEIAVTALHHYNTVLPPHKGKPKENEWTVFAAIVAVVTTTKWTNTTTLMNDTDDTVVVATNTSSTTTTTTTTKTPSKDTWSMWVVSCATGTKCCAIPLSDTNNGGSDATAASTTSSAVRTVCSCHHHHHHIVRDSHAEVLARRGLLRVLWNEMIVYMKITMEPERHDTPTTTNSSNNNSATMLLRAIPMDSVSTTTTTGSNNNNNNKDDKRRMSHFVLRDDIELHMYISDALCGDASIYPLKQPSPPPPPPAMIMPSTTTTTTTTTTNISNSCNTSSSRNTTAATTSSPTVSSRCSSISSCSRNSGSININKFTGSKAIIVDPLPKQIRTSDSMLHDESSSQQQQIRIIRETAQPDQYLGQLRTKSGRSNIELHRRSSSMSCSDKFVRWSIFGLQGALLSKYIVTPLRLSSIVVGHDPAAAAVTTTTAPTASSAVESKEPQEFDQKSNRSFESSQTMALRRAIPNRVTLVQQFLRRLFVNNNDDDNEISVLLQRYINEMTIPNVFVTNHIFSRGKANVESEFTATTMAVAAITTSEIATNASLPSPIVVPTTATTTSFTSGRKRKNPSDVVIELLVDHSNVTKASVAGIAMNWHMKMAIGICNSSNNDRTRMMYQDVELIVGVRGIRQGKKPKCTVDAVQLQSQLCRNELLMLLEQFLLLFHGDNQRRSSNGSNDSSDDERMTIAMAHDNYDTFKTLHCSPVYRIIRERIFSMGSPLYGWLVGDHNNNPSSSNNNNKATHCY